jgi:D-arginine dehydrogenase
MSGTSFDIIVIGAGIAGASAAAELARTHRVVMLERENAPGYHSTGRSAALFSEIYGNEVVRALSRASRPFFFDPPKDFPARTLVKKRGSLHIASEGQRATLDAFADNPDVKGAVSRVSQEKALALCPILRPEAAVAAVMEQAASDVDVHALHDGYLRQFRHAGGTLVTDAGVTALSCRNKTWSAATKAGTFSAPIVINAGGAWADEIAKLAGAGPQHIEPRRRTALLIEVPETKAFDSWPMVIDIDESFYMKPDAGLLLVSPADETPVEACDVQPEELDIAVAIDRLERATTLKVARVRKKWAGLRSFSPMRTPVIGFDPEREGFFWLAGQGGYGIQTAPAIAALVAGVIRGDALLASLSGFDAHRVAPARVQTAQSA